MEGGQVAVMSDGITNFRQRLPFPPSPRAGTKRYPRSGAEGGDSARRRDETGRGTGAPTTVSHNLRGTAGGYSGTST